MGKIQEYDVGSFSPQAVGVPGEDKSGQILASGAMSLGKAISAYEDKSNSLSAMTKFNDFRFRYENIKVGLQEKHRNEPGKFVEELRKEEQTLNDTVTKSMPGGELEKFKQIRTSFQGQEIDSVVGWAAKRDLDIKVDKVKSLYGDLSVASEGTSTPEELKALLGDPNTATETEHSLAGANKMAVGVLDPSGIQALDVEAKKNLIDTHLDSRVHVDAARVYDDLQRGKYNGIVPAHTISRYTTIAKTAMINNAILEQYRNLATGSVEVAETHDKIVSGEITVGDVNRKIQWAELHKNDLDANKEKVISDNYLRGLYANRDIALGLRPLTQKEVSEQSKTADTDFERRWFNYLAGRKRKGKPSPADYDDVIGLYADLEENFLSGTITSSAYEDKRKLMDNKLKSELNKGGTSASLSEALSKAGKYHFWDNPRDVYAVGYEMVEKHLKEQRPDLTPEERLRYREQYLLAYTQKVNAIPEGQRDVRNKEQFAIDALYGNASKGIPGVFEQLGVYKHPETKAPLMFGQKTRLAGQEVQFIGINPKTGKYRWATSDDFKKNVGK